MKKFTADFETSTWLPDSSFVWAWALCEIGNTNNLKIGNTIDSFFEEIRKEYNPLILLSTFSLLTTTACTKKEDQNKFYNDLYTSDYVEVYKDEVRLTNKAQYGYFIKLKYILK